jgi:hypothetical protein
MENQVGIHMNNNANDFTVMFCVRSYFMKCIHYSYRIHLSNKFLGIADKELHQNQFSLKESVWCGKFNRVKELVPDHILKSQTFGDPSW